MLAVAQLPDRTLAAIQLTTYYVVVVKSLGLDVVKRSLAEEARGLNYATHDLVCYLLPVVYCYVSTYS